MTEHMLLWFSRLLPTVLISIIAFWIKRFINHWDQKEHDWDQREKEWTEAGGLVTRNLHFDWCEQAREKCPVAIWRTVLDGSGGAVTLNQMASIRGQIDDAFSHNRELVIKDIQLMMKEVQIDRGTIDSIKVTVDKNEERLADLSNSVSEVIKNQQSVLEWKKELQKR